MVVSKYHEPEVYMNIYEVRLTVKKNTKHSFFSGSILQRFANRTFLYIHVQIYISSVKLFAIHKKRRILHNVDGGGGVLYSMWSIYNKCTGISLLLELL